MCQILFMYKCNDEKIESTEAERFARQMTSAGYSNSDGWGFFTNDNFYKSPRQFDESSEEWLVEQIVGKKYVVGHVRLATHGTVSKQNSHPYIEGEWALVHNGIINNVRNEKDVKEDISDSHGLLRRIMESEEEKVADKIKQTAEKCSGYWSVFVSGPDDKLYYFKHGSAKFTFAYVPHRKLYVGYTNGSFTDDWKLYTKGFFISENSIMERAPPEDIVFCITDDLLVRERYYKVDTAKTFSYGEKKGNITIYSSTNGYGIYDETSWAKDWSR